MSGCNSTKGTKVAEPLICQWTIITMQHGVSVVPDGNPAKKSVEELLESGVGFQRKVDREINCRPYGDPPGGVITTPPGAPPKKSPSRKSRGTLVYNNISE